MNRFGYILQRYITKRIFLTILLVTLIVVGLEMFILFLGQLHEIGTGGYGTLQAFIYVIYSLPQTAYTLFPMVALLGAVIGLGSLASHSELIVMRVSGMSISQIVSAILKAAIILIILVTAVGEWLGPISMEKGTLYKVNAESGVEALHLSHGVWVRNAEQFIHVQRVMTDRHLTGIIDYHFNGNHQLLSALHADYAVYHDGDWKLYNVHESLIHTSGIKIVTQSVLPWHVSLLPKMFSISISQPDQLSLPSLNKYIKYRVRNGLGASNYQLAFWQRICQPLATIVMMLLAIPFIFGPLRSVTLSIRIISAIGVGFSFYLLNQFFGPLTIVYQLSPLLAAVLPSLLFFMLAMFLLRRVK